MKVQFLGCGDAFGSGGRLQSCILVESGEKHFLVDCGASAMISLNKYGIDPDKISMILVSNLHGDHFGGIPYFISDAQLNKKRNRSLTIIGPPGLKKRLEQVNESTFPGSARVKLNFELVTVELSPGDHFITNGITIAPYGGVHGTDDIHLIYRIEFQGKKFTYTGETEWTEKILPAARGVDLLIAEAYFYAKKVKYHLDYRTLMSHFSELDAKKIVLTHMSQDILDNVSTMGCDYAEDGKVIEI